MYTDAPIQVNSFYRFTPLSENEVRRLVESIESLSTDFDLRGLMILGPEGINSTLSVAKDQGESLRQELRRLLDLPEIEFKISYAPRHPFNDLKLKVRKEIVTLNRPDIVPHHQNHHLSPDEWHKMMDDPDAVVVDTRNDYEYDIGHFEGALNPNIKEFTEFPEYLRKSEIPKDKKLMIYCTGGIRCEKAIYDAQEQGYKNVYQLDGGILNYLKERPNQKWDGECFVFDFRVAVDQDLKPTEQYRLCPHCGDPGNVKIDCIQCGLNATVCQKCLDKEKQNETCSKNCAHHHRMGHTSKRIHKDGIRGWQGL